MSQSRGIEILVYDLLEWISREERTYAEVMDAWRTSCPRLPIWEEASDRGLVATIVRDRRRMVEVTAAGLAFLEKPGTDLRLD
jgi:hypothetical protein